ncbi:Rv0361 family membrane protein [Mycobacteroides chelonae]|uniref:Rv0361 family membrane protein n=2 Tax=Mycobacteroides chelonae TaxID=1774 RepID=UPI003FEE13CC
MTRVMSKPAKRTRLNLIRSRHAAFRVVAVLSTALILSSCEQAEGENIEGVVRAFNSAVDREDYPAARALSCGKMASDLSRSDDELRTGRDVAGLIGGVKAQLTAVAAPYIQGDIAHVQITVKYPSQLSGANDVTRNYELNMQKESPGWRICSYVPAAQ